ncbi:MAG: FxLYD domain-containing protein [Muribaculaceae bacterium]|nr:FxLYD domain-containing protein [Muribaculaceae bacterium]
MKVSCDFCKTEYTLPGRVSGPVKCAVCGRVWTVRNQTPRSAIMVLFAATCALLAAIIFTFVVIVHHQAAQASDKPLVATVTDVHSVVDAAGNAHFVVSGVVSNNSDEIYGVPNLVIVSYDDNGRVIGRQKFLSPATLLDAGTSVTFSHTLSTGAVGVKNIQVEFDAIGDMQ